MSLLVKPGSAVGTHFYTATLQELIDGVDFVFIGKVKNVERTFWGYRRATLQVTERIKGESLSEMSVNYGARWYDSQANVSVLITGRRYLFFILEIEGKLQLAGITGPRYYLIEDNDDVLCGDENIPVTECIERGVEIVSERIH
nr:hypothetical protein [Candidatus Electrothrix aestuarii]